LSAPRPRNPFAQQAFRELNLRSGKKLTLGHSLRDKHEIDWLISEMQRLAGLNPKSMTAGMA
jgi:hypothetical protein